MTAEDPPEPEAAEPAKKRKKRKKKSAADADAAPVVLPGAGTPEGDRLREANAAFEAGNYALVRSLTGALESASDPKVVDAARDLARRIAVDPVQIAFLLLCLVALCAIAYVYVLR
jgi:hypothetical protein